MGRISVNNNKKAVIQFDKQLSEKERKKERKEREANRHIDGQAENERKREILIERHTYIERNTAIQIGR